VITDAERCEQYIRDDLAALQTSRERLTAQLKHTAEQIEQIDTLIEKWQSVIDHGEPIDGKHDD